MSKIIVVVEGGVVQNVYSTRSDIIVEVLDFDISDYPEDEDVLQLEQNERRLKEIKNSSAYIMVW